MRTAARIISFVFHPLLLATYLVLTLGAFFPAMLMIRIENLKWVALYVFAFTFFIPAANLLLLKLLGTISSLQLESLQERKQPFVVISIIYGIVVYLFPFTVNFNKLMIIVAALVVVATVMTFFLKVSVHGLAMGGWIGILLPLTKYNSNLLWPTAMVIVLTGVVISARLLLNAHTLRETLIGAIAGIAVGYGGMMFLF